MLWQLVLSYTLIAQEFSGRVLDSQTTKPIPFAGVYVTNVHLGTFTDTNGYFQFDIALPTTVEVRVNAEFYKTRVLSFQLGKEAVEIYLDPSHTDMEDVVVSTPRGGLSGDNVFKVNRMKLKDLNTIQSSNLSEAMANMSGVQVASTGAGISKPVIRGMQGLRVLNLVNGIRINNQQWGGDHGLAISELGIGSVELIKGPSSLLYGSDALGGVIYLVDAPYPAQGKQSIQMNSGFESVNMGSNSSLLYGISKGNFRLSAGALYSTYADYQLPNSKFLKNSRYNQLGGKLSMTYTKKNWVSHLRYSYSNLQTGIPGHTHDSIIDPLSFQSNEQIRKSVIPYQRNILNLASFENKFFFNKNELQVLFSYSKNELWEFEDKITIPALGMFLNNIGANLRFSQVLSEKSKLIYGYQGLVQQSRNDSKAEETLIPEFNQLDNGAYAIAYFKLGNMNIQLGARFDYRKLDVASDSLNTEYISPNFSVGFVQKVKRNSFRLNLSSGYRAPHVSELLSDGIHHGALRYERGSRSLKSEYSVQIDADYEFEGDHLSLVFNPFYNQLLNYISTTATDTIIEGAPVFDYVSIDQVSLFGADLGIHYHPHFAHFLHLESTYSYVRGHEESGRNLDLMPQARINTLLKFIFEGKWVKALDNFAIQHEYYFAQNRTADFETISKAYNLLNLGINGEVGKKQQFSWSCGVKNLLNESYINHLSRLKNINTPHPGRNIYFSMSYKLDY